MKHIDVRYIKPKLSYPIQELAELFEIHANTILNWVHKEGLPLIDEDTPFFIYGQHLLNFLNYRQLKNKRTLDLVECYCCKCRAPRTPLSGTQVIRSQSSVYTYRGTCSLCGTQMSRIVSVHTAEEITSLLASDMMETRLSQSDLLHLNLHIKEPEYMTAFNAENERVKWSYFQYEKEANGKCDKTIDKIRKGLQRYEEFTGHQLFKAFNRKIAISYKNYLITSSGVSGGPLTLSTIYHSLRALQSFYKWLALQSGYKKSIRFDDIEYLNLNNKDRQRILPGKLKEYPSLAEIGRVLQSMRPVGEIQMRNQAIFACFLTTGVRDGALIGLKLKHIDINRGYLIQDPAEVETKFGKLINTKFFPVGAVYHEILVNWVKYLREVKSFDENAPLFPKEGLSHDGNFTIRRGFLSSCHWRTAGRVREIVADAFASCGLRRFPPHRFRDTLADLGKTLCQTTDQKMAWAQNLGHKHYATTFGVYGSLTPEFQFELIAALSTVTEPNSQISDIAKEIAGLLVPELIGRFTAQLSAKPTS